MSLSASSRHLYILAGGLAAIGLGLFLFKLLVLGFPLTPNRQSDVWDVEVRVAFTAQGGPVKASLLIPRETRRFTVLDENFVSRGYGLTTANVDGNRQVSWSIRSARGMQVLYYRAAVRPLGKHDQPVVEERAPALPEIDLSGSERAAAQVLAGEIKVKSADVETMVAELVNRLNVPAPDANVQLLLGQSPNGLKRIRAAVQVLALAGVAARPAHGIQLKDLERNVRFTHWLQVYDKGLWRSVDPKTGQMQLPDDYLTWWRGEGSLLRVKGGSGVDARVSVAMNKETALGGATVRGQRLVPGLLSFSLFSLPLETQAVYHVLLMVPIGALILVLMRNVVGFKTFGTFMPVLIALAFRQTQLFWGVILFSLVVGLGLSVRFYLERLKLLLVPRLASVLIVVVMLMAAISILSHKLGVHQGLSIALFPMVIMTMTIERMSIVWEERGAGEAFQEGGGSLAVAALTYIVMAMTPMQHLLFVFPELLLVVLAATLLLGRYTGYRLTELRRFRALAGK